MPDKFVGVAAPRGNRFPPTQCPDCYIAIGNRQSQLGNYPSALAAYDKAITVAPAYGRSYNYRGSFRYAKLGDIQGAMADFNLAIEWSQLQTKSM
jgi:tetratricopeptide (TPR) repeat protein